MRLLSLEKRLSSSETVVPKSDKDLEWDKNSLLPGTSLKIPDLSLFFSFRLSVERERALISLGKIPQSLALPFCITVWTSNVSRLPTTSSFSDLEVFVKVVFLCESLSPCLPDKFTCAFEVCFDRSMLSSSENFLESLSLSRELDASFLSKALLRMFIFSELMVVGPPFSLSASLMLCKELLPLRLLEESLDLSFLQLTPLAARNSAAAAL